MTSKIATWGVRAACGLGGAAVATASEPSSFGGLITSMMPFALNALRQPVNAATSAAAHANDLQTAVRVRPTRAESIFSIAQTRHCPHTAWRALNKKK